MDVRNDEVRLPTNDFRQFKVSIADITDVEQSPLYELNCKRRHGREVEEIEKTRGSGVPSAWIALSSGARAAKSSRRATGRRRTR